MAYMQKLDLYTTRCMTISSGNLGNSQLANPLATRRQARFVSSEIY
jgi:hypothetical protein